MTQNKQILYNAIKTPDGTILESRTRRHFNSHTDKNGNFYAVDGGREYLRRIYDVKDFEDLTVYDDGTHALRRKYLKWGSIFDKDMNRLDDVIHRSICDMSTDHIQSIIDGNWVEHQPFYKEVFLEELKYRQNGKNI